VRKDTGAWVSSLLGANETGERSLFMYAKVDKLTTNGYNANMMADPGKRPVRARSLAAIAARYLDPRTVRLEDPSRPAILRRPAAALSLVGALALGAAALAATGRSGEPGESAPAGAIADVGRPSGSPAEERAEASPPGSLALDPPRPPNFHDPLYVFTDGLVERVEAYPLADPPGFVVDLIGAPEPQAAADEMVGADPRTRSVKRRVTDRGVRYVIWLTTPLRRIEVLHEGSVVIVSPVD